MFHCQTDPRAKLDIARFLILLDQGGVAMDLDQLPLPAFLSFNANGTVGSNGTDAAGESNFKASFIIDDANDCAFEVSGKNNALVANPRFIACDPKRPAQVIGITLCLSNANSIGGCYNDSCPYGNDGYQRSMYM
jgi:hypothetical protein